MASCPKCGKTKVRKRKKDGRRECRRCGLVNITRTSPKEE